jgi:lipoate-protein ligase A
LDFNKLNFHIVFKLKFLREVHTYFTTRNVCVVVQENLHSLNVAISVLVPANSLELKGKKLSV